MKLKTDEKTLKALQARAVEALKAATPMDSHQHAWSLVEYTTLELRMPNGDRVNFQYAKNLKEMNDGKATR